jgi:probable F420-dependent oxidoreductase
MPRPFRFGLVTAYAPSRAAWVGMAQHAEELGYATLLMPDRTSGGLLSVMPALTVAASVTTRLRVGSYVFANGYRHPVLLAREAATLDLLSEGRFELGIGAGVSATEYEQMGIPYPSAGIRIKQLEETVRLLKQLLTQETVNFSGKYYTVHDLHGIIKPVQQPHVPLLMAGAGERMLKVAAHEANIIAIGSRFGMRGSEPSDATLEQKVDWIKSGAGERFHELELGQSIYDLEITDSSAPLAAETGGWVVPKRQVTSEQAINQLMEQRERYNISYLQISAQQMENFAPVLAQLAGK